jgi:hypothetical protein
MTIPIKAAGERKFLPIEFIFFQLAIGESSQGHIEDDPLQATFLVNIPPIFAD